MMKLVVAIVLIVAVQAIPKVDHQLFLKDWKNFKKNFHKKYENNKEESHRQTTFLRNLKKINEHNRRFVDGSVSFEKGINQFTDMTFKEFSSMMLNRNLTSEDKKSENKKIEFFKMRDDFNAPKSVDWRKHGAVSNVTAQGVCGSCWAFAAIGAMEGAHFVKNKKLVPLSVQDVIDCNLLKFGCDGGPMGVPFDYAIKCGIVTERSYPYENKQGSCRHKKKKVAAKIESYRQMKGADAMVNAIADHSPIATVIEATENLYGYQSGIFEDDTCTGESNHAVLTVGYGSENGTDYWIIKNSWGEDFGEKGYLRIIRGKNNCMIESSGYLPISK